MLDADAQIIPARDEGEDRGSPESDEPDKLGKGELWQRASENQRSQRYQLQRGFPFGELRNRDGDAQIRQKFPQSRHRSEEHTSELQSLMRTSYAVYCLHKTKTETSLS